MMLALALLLLDSPAPAPLAAQRGTLVLCGEAFELPAALSRELAGNAPHALLATKGDVLDPLCGGDSPARRADLAGDPGSAREARALAALEGTRTIVVEAATWLECWQLFKPEFKDSRLELELRHAWQNGCTVIACGAAASYLASWSIVPREEIHRAVRNPRHAEAQLIANGLGLFDGWAVDTAAQEPSGAARLLGASRRFGNARALYLAGPVAWIVREDGRAVELAGSGLAAVFDLSHARRSREDLREGRLVLLGAGERLRIGRELELASADPRAPEDPAWSTGALARLALPFQPVRLPRPGLEYVFDWTAQR